MESTQTDSNMRTDSDEGVRASSPRPPGDPAMTSNPAWFADPRYRPIRAHRADTPIHPYQTTRGRNPPPATPEVVQNLLNYRYLYRFYPPSTSFDIYSPEILNSPDAESLISRKILKDAAQRGLAKARDAKITKVLSKQLEIQRELGSHDLRERVLASLEQEFELSRQKRELAEKRKFTPWEEGSLYARKREKWEARKKVKREARKKEKYEAKKKLQFSVKEKEDKAKKQAELKEKREAERAARKQVKLAADQIIAEVEAQTQQVLGVNNLGAKKVAVTDLGVNDLGANKQQERTIKTPEKVKPAVNEKEKPDAREKAEREAGRQGRRKAKKEVKRAAKKQAKLEAEQKIVETEAQNGQEVGVTEPVATELGASEQQDPTSKTETPEEVKRPDKKEEKREAKENVKSEARKQTKLGANQHQELTIKHKIPQEVKLEKRKARNGAKRAAKKAKRAARKQEKLAAKQKIAQKQPKLGANYQQELTIKSKVLELRANVQQVLKLISEALELGANDQQEFTVQSETLELVAEGQEQPDSTTQNEPATAQTQHSLAMSSKGKKRRGGDYEVNDGFVEADSDQGSDPPRSKKLKTEKSHNPSKSNGHKLTSGASNVPGGGARADNGEEYWELSNKRRVTVSSYNKKLMINIREYYEKDGQQLPGKKGISLPLDQFSQLVTLLPHLETVLKGHGETLSRPKYTKAGEVEEGDEEEEEEGDMEEEAEEESRDVKGSKSVKRGKKNFEETSDEDE